MSAVGIRSDCRPRRREIEVVVGELLLETLDVGDLNCLCDLPPRSDGTYAILSSVESRLRDEALRWGLLIGLRCWCVY